jgi:MYXO-CTERM domain-containing protein
MMKNVMTQSNPRKPLTALGHWLVGAVTASVVLACANQAPSGGKDEVKAVQSPITSACTLQTLGLPCDPDQAGAATECGGVCWVGADQQAACFTLEDMGMAVTDLNGRICGDSVGQNCGQSCENGVCVTKNARLGTACRPTASSSTCEGLCTLSGGVPFCDTVTVCADTPRVEGCILQACGFGDNTTGCQEYTLAAGTTCSDGLACTSGDTCDVSGACVPTTNNCGGAGGQGGAGGEPGGSAGTAGTATGGAATGGTATGGSAGTATGGSAGKAGSAGTATGGSAGKAGSAGTATGGVQAGGAAGDGGKPGGSPGAGTAGRSQGGAAGSTSRTGGSGAVVPPVTSVERFRITGGGCATTRDRTPSTGFGLLMLLGLGFGFGWRSRQRTRRSA